MNIPLTSTLAKKAPRIGQGLYYDPLYGYIPVANELRQIIDSEVFQRLRGIKQLSTLYLVFAGAHHTRFEHSIGVSYLAGLVHERLKDYISFEKNSTDTKNIRLNKITLLVTQVVGLLHDIGHGPFAHVFEMFCTRSTDYSHWNHEAWGRCLITGDFSNFKIEKSQKEIFNQIPTLLRNLQKRLSTEFPDDPLIGLLEPENIANLCFDQPPKLNSDELTDSYYFLVDVVTSPYGVDRLDYLRRDAYYTGVKTGEIDIWEIIRNLQLHKEDGLIKLFLSPSAGTGVEALIRSRDAVYRKIYHNPVSRNAQELIVRGLLALGKAPETLAFLSDNDLLDYFRNSDNSFIREIEERIRFRILYELLPICSYTDIMHSISVLENMLEDKSFITKEQKINSAIGLKEGYCVFFDIEKVPCVKEYDITKKIFFIRSINKSQSLVELFPHIKEQFFNDNGMTRARKIEEYKNYISRIYVSFPFEYISEEIERILAENTLEQHEKIENEISILYVNKLQPIVNYFFRSMLGWGDGTMKKEKNMLDLIRLNSEQYLRDIIHVKQNLWIKD